MRVFVLLFVLVTFSISRPLKRASVFTFDTVFTYEHVLKQLSYQSKRSVVGSSDALKISRQWRIIDKKFNSAVEAIRMNAKTDGYELKVGSDYIYIFPIDTTVADTVFVDDSDTTFLYYSEITGLWRETDNIAEFRNFPVLDSIAEVRRELKTTLRKISIELVGFTDNWAESNGLDITTPIFKITPAPHPIFKVSDIFDNSGAVLGYPSVALELENTDTKYNFHRTMEFYMPLDTLMTFNFTSERRREQGKHETDGGTVSIEYESVFEGLTVEIKDSVYTAHFRIDDTELTMMGILGSPISASAQLEETIVKRLLPFRRWFGLPHKKEMVQTDFNLSLIIKEG